MRVAGIILMALMAVGAAPAKAPTSKPAKPTTAYTERAEKFLRANKVRPADAKKIRDRAKQMDAAVTKELATGSVTEKVADALRECKPAVGMTLAQLKLIGHLEDRGGAGTETTYSFLPLDPVPHTVEATPVYRVEVDGDGKVVSYDKIQG